MKHNWLSVSIIVELHILYCLLKASTKFKGDIIASPIATFCPNFFSSTFKMQQLTAIIRFIRVDQLATEPSHYRHVCPLYSVNVHLRPAPRPAYKATPESFSYGTLLVSLLCM